MGRERCVLNNCRNQSSDVKIFRFPFKSKNRKLLDAWLENIPKDLYVAIENPSFICEDHFEKKFIRTNNGLKRLHPDAVPTVFKDSQRRKSQRAGRATKCMTYDGSSCRFCLMKFPGSEKQITINSYIRKQYLFITQIELKTSEVFSQNICESCFNSTRDFATFRNKLIENQKKLEQTFKGFDEEEYSECTEEFKINTKDSFFSDEDGEDILVKVERLSDAEEHLDGTFLDENLKEEKEEIEFDEWNETSLTQDSDGSSRTADHKRRKHDYTAQSSISEDISTEKPENSNQNKRMCEICGKWFSSMTYRRHFDNMHLRKKKCICDICGYRSFKKFDMKHHIFRHLKIKSFMCESCPASFPSKTELRAHLIVHTNQRDFICDIENCSAAFKKRDSLKRHQRIHFNDRQHECSECSRKFHDAYRLRLHQQSVHLPPDPTQQSPCPVCQKIFKSPLAMNKHLIYHKPPELKCEICHKEFYRKIVLTTHMRIAHEGKKNFHCKYCSSSYFKNSHLNRHILTVHMKQKVSCQVEGCSQTFPLKDRYRVHINSHHQNLGEQRVKQLLEDVKNLDATYENPEFELSPPLV